MDKQVRHLMEKLKISEAEAIQVIADDKAIDKGAKLFELTDDQKKTAKQATNAKRGPTVYQFQKRERKQNTGKRAIMEHLETVHLSKSITAISKGLFKNCPKLKTVNIEPTLKSIGEYAITNTNIESVVLSDELTTIEQYTFSGCSNLKNVTFGKNIE
jgi:hypothetical protein